MYKVNHHGYCGMAGIPACFDTEREARDYCAKRLANLRHLTRVTTLLRGKEWEALEPEGCAMVPDFAGTLRLSHITFECRECGYGYETQHDALHCCADYEGSQS